MKFKRLAHEPEDPPLREVRKQIRIEIRTLISSYTEADGILRNESAIYEIGCLRKALKLLPTRLPKGVQ